MKASTKNAVSIGRPLLLGGLDVGQQTDHTVLATLCEADGIDDELWVVDRVDRLPLRMPFREQLTTLQTQLDRLDMLIVDSGGTGQALPELINGNRLQRLVPAVIVGGQAEGRVTKGRVVVGKSRLIGGLMHMVMSSWLRVDPSAPGADLLRDEMAAFRYVQNGRFRKMEAARGHHDDAVMAVALAAYLARTLVRQTT